MLFFYTDKKVYLCTTMCRDGGMVDTGDLKSPGQEWPCGFESRSRYNSDNSELRIFLNYELRIANYDRPDGLEFGIGNSKLRKIRIS